MQQLVLICQSTEQLNKKMYVLKSLPYYNAHHLPGCGTSFHGLELHIKVVTLTGHLFVYIKESTAPQIQKLHQLMSNY